MGESFSVEVKSITTYKSQKLYIGEYDVEAIKGKRVLIVDDVISTGESLKAIQKLAEKAGAAVVGTGRSDFKNQINNVLAFPGIFRGALDVRASDINEEMKVAASKAIASLISDDELSADYIIPKAFDKRVGKAVAQAVAQAAKDSGVARI